MKSMVSASSPGSMRIRTRTGSGAGVMASQLGNAGACTRWNSIFFSVAGLAASEGPELMSTAQPSTSSVSAAARGPTGAGLADRGAAGEFGAPRGP